MPHPGRVTPAQITGVPANDWGVRVFALADNQRPNAPQTYHGISIGAAALDPGGTTANNISPVGRITNWNPQNYTRDAVHSYELSAQTYGKAVDLTPGRNTTYTASISRVELWQQELEVALGLTDTDEVFEDLMDQDRPFQVDETLMRSTSLYRHWRYRGCWLTNMNATEFSAEGGDQRIIRSGELMFVRRQRVQ